MLSKSQFLKYIQCCKYLWLYKFRRDLLPEETGESLQGIFDEGYEVEDYARKLFPKGVKAEGLYETAKNNTDKLIKDGNEVIFQATAMAKSLYAMADIFVKNGDKWDIYEVKSSTQVKDIHIVDLSFQKICFESAGYQIGKTYLVVINTDYVRMGQVDPKKLFKIEDITSDVRNIISETKLNIVSALKLTKSPKEPQIRILKQCNSPYECPFIDYCWKKIPVDSIYDIACGLSEKKLNELLDQDILEIKDIPEDFLNRDRALMHRHVVKHNKVHIESDKIKEDLNNLKYPLYFLDYETFSPAIPLFDGYKPYQRIVFQFSLHVQEKPCGKLKHYEFLAKDFKDPTEDLLKSLKSFITCKGTVITWNAIFEKGCNSEMAKRSSKYVSFLKSVNDSMYDLMLIFRKGYYVHKNFHGSASIKKVLPVLVPKLSYKDLNIQEGGTASDSWKTLIDPGISKKDKDKLYKDMTDYCGLDTMAMVEILNFLQHLH